MAHLTTMDILKPRGEIDVQLFPGKTLDEVELDIAALLALAYEKTESRYGLTGESPDEEVQNTAVAAYVYHRIFRGIWLLMIRQPSTVTFTDQGTKTISRYQTASFLALADYWWNQYVMLMPESIVGPPPVQPSMSIPFIPRF